jgi:hypothetical protein
MSAPILQFKRGTFSNLDFGLRAGEPALTSDTFDLFVGINSTFENNKFFGSHRYWQREDGIDSLQLKLVDEDGVNSINLKSPEGLSGITTYTLPETPTDGFFLRTNAFGVLEWASLTADASFENASFTGITTFSGLIDANAGLDVVGGSTFDNINVTGIATVGTTLDVNGLADLTNVNVSVAATIASADINGGTIDATVIGGETAAAGTFTHLVYSSSSTSGISTVGELYVGTTQVLYDDDGLITLAGITTIDATTKATLEQILSLDPNDFDTLNVAGISTIGGLLDANGGLDVTGQTTLNNDLEVTGVSTFTGLVEADGGLDVTGHTELDNLNVSGVSTFSGTLNSSTLIAATNFTASGIATVNTLEVTENTTLGDGSGDVLTVNATSTFNAPATFLDTLTGTISTATRATQVDTTATGDNVSYYVPFVANSTSTTGETIRVDAGISYNPDSNTLTVPNIQTENLKHSNGTQSIAIDSSGNVGLSSNLTVAGNLFVNGSTTSVNTETLKVKDSLIDLGKIDDGSGTLIAPTSDLNIDIGVLFNYFADAASRKAAVYWDDSEGRIAVASRVTEAASVLTAQAYAALEVGGLWVNNACTGGAAEIISCFSGTELEVRNVLIDAGTF